MSGAFSASPLQRLLEAQAVPVMVGIAQRGPAPAAPIRVRQPFPDCRDVAADHGLDARAIPFDGQARLAELGCDGLLVACWPWIIPATILAEFPAGAFNLHPSLLPRYRGPDPLFWQLRDAVPESGVTLHRLAAAVDAGRIVGQRRVAIDEEQTEPGLERQLGDLGGDLAVQLVQDLRMGTVQDRPQGREEASYQPRPRAEDFRIPVTWSARRAYRFMHAVEARRHPFDIVSDSGARRVRRALAYRLRARLARPPWSEDGEVLQVQFADGVLIAQR